MQRQDLLEHLVRLYLLAQKMPNRQLAGVASTQRLALCCPLSRHLRRRNAAPEWIQAARWLDQPALCDLPLRQFQKQASPLDDAKSWSWNRRAKEAMRAPDPCLAVEC